MMIPTAAPAPASLALAASDGVPISQQVSLVRDGMQGTIKYRAYEADPYWRASKGRAYYDFDVYRLHEREPRWDYYFVNVVLRRKASSGWSYENLRVSLTTAYGYGHRVNRTSYTPGRSTFKRECKNYPLSLGVGYGPVSAGTTVATLRSCNDAPSVSRYLNYDHRTGLFTISGMKDMPRVMAQKWIRVRQGRTPPFYVAISARRDVCVDRRDGYCYTWGERWSDSRGQYLYYQR
jgi:hypothetical protein